MQRKIKVIGAGLAGSEAAWQLAKRNIPVELYDMKPYKKSPAHKSDLFAELVCSNSLRSDRTENAAGLLKEEMRRLGSIVMEAADAAKLPAGGALAVDREKFSEFITQKLANHPCVSVKHEEVTRIPNPPAIIATGPLTSESLSRAIAEFIGREHLSFYDAVAPIIYKDSIDMSHCFKASRYERGSDYLNCPLDEKTYERFIEEVVNAETVPVKGFEDSKVFEACMPVETMAKRGFKTLAFGPLKPKGLTDPKTNKMPYAVLQLRQDDADDRLYNLVGFQTRLTFSEQKRVFGIIPALKNARYARLGVMHRNTFINSPVFLNRFYEAKDTPNLFFAGQITGVEGYVESAASGLLAGLSLCATIKGIERPDFTNTTAIGALAQYISRQNSNFQPMNVNFGIMSESDKRIRSKKQRYEHIAKRALDEIETIKKKLPEETNATGI